MAKLTPDSLRRIAGARQTAESELKKAICGVAKTHDVEPYLPAWSSFATTQQDAEGREWSAVCGDVDAYKAELQTVATRILDDIMPDRGLNSVNAWQAGGVNLIMHEMDTDLLREVGPDRRTRTRGRAEIQGVYAQNGDWEKFMPKGYRFHLRDTKNNELVGEVLSQALEQGQYYLVDRFRPRLTGDLPQLRAELPAASSTERQVQAESGRPANKREAFVRPILIAKGWSTFDWADHSIVDGHTTINYLKEITKPRHSTREKLAKSLGVPVEDLPV